MSKNKIILMILLLIFSFYIIVWIISGRDLLYDKCANILIDEKFLNFHKNEKIFIVSKYCSKNFEYNYDFQIQNKELININTKEEEFALWEQESEKLRKYDYTNCFLEINIIKYNILFAIVESRLSINDIDNDQLLFIWTIFGWINVHSTTLY